MTRDCDEGMEIEKKYFNKQMTFLKQAYDIYYILFSAKIYSACLDFDLF